MRLLGIAAASLCGPVPRGSFACLPEDILHVCTVPACCCTRPYALPAASHAFFHKCSLDTVLRSNQAFAPNQAFVHSPLPVLTCSPSAFAPSLHCWRALRGRCALRTSCRSSLTLWRLTPSRMPSAGARSGELRLVSVESQYCFEAGCVAWRCLRCR